MQLSKYKDMDIDHKSCITVWFKGDVLVSMHEPIRKMQTVCF